MRYSGNIVLISFSVSKCFLDINFQCIMFSTVLEMWSCGLLLRKKVMRKKLSRGEKFAKFRELTLANHRFCHFSRE